MNIKNDFMQRQTKNGLAGSRSKMTGSEIEGADMVGVDMGGSLNGLF